MIRQEDPEERQKPGPHSAIPARDDLKSLKEDLWEWLRSRGGELGTPPERLTMTAEDLSREEMVSEIDSWMALLNKYVLLEKLDEGGTGSVWLVRHLVSGERRALKIIHPSIARMPSVRARFRREVQALTQLKHPNAVIVHDIGVAGSVCYIEMENLEGQTLRERLKPGECMPLDKVVWLLRELCEVLGHAHMLGIVHRDIKPENIMIFPDPESGRERVKVLDFAIGEMIEDEGGPEQTGVAGFFGTPAYMSPEQIRGGIERGSEKHKLDGRSDLYSTGVVLYEVLTGTLPFRGTISALLAAHLKNPPLPMKEANPKAEVSPELERVVLHCLEKMPDDRPESAGELVEAFRKAVGDYEAPTRVEADVSFPTQVLVGKPYHLHIQLVRPEGDPPGGATRAQPRRHGDDGAANLLVSHVSSARPAATSSLQSGSEQTAVAGLMGTPAHTSAEQIRGGIERGGEKLKVSISVVAENFEFDGNCREEIVVSPEGNSSVLQFSLHGLEVGSGRVMIDFSQGGRPIGSMDLAPEVVADLDVKDPASLPGSGLQALSLNLAAGPMLAPPDLVIKVFEHRLAGVPGRLQFVLSSTRRELSDLPILDGDVGTLDLRTEVADWVGEHLRAVGTLAEQPDVTAEEAAQTLTDIGYNLFHQLLPPALQELCWTFRQRGVKTMMILSDEPHIPWELIKPYREDLRTGEFEEYPFWGESFALTHWLRGRPPAPQLSIRRAVTVAAGTDRARFRPEQEGGSGSLTGSTPGGVGPEMIRDMHSTGSASTAGVVERFLETASGPRTVEDSPICAPGSGASLAALASAEEETEVMHFLESLGATVTRLPARRKELQTMFERGEFDLLHLASHSTFGGTSSGDASAVLLDDGVFTAALLSPRMAGPLRRCAPLVFFNTCHSGRLGFCPTRLGAWGARLVELGCGGFIGALWPVTDRAAVVFARAFYGLIAQRRPIGEAIQLSRLQVREQFPNDPTWLAYCCFADPMAKIESLIPCSGELAEPGVR
jgi:serine/threonine protein kinase